MGMTNLDIWWCKHFASNSHLHSTEVFCAVFLCLLALTYIKIPIHLFLEIFALSAAACPDVRTCYNCQVIGSCVMIASTGTWLTEEQCMQRLLLYSVVWSVEYESLTGTCYQNSCDDQVVYKKGSVVHRKTCDTGKFSAHLYYLQMFY
jgi:PhoPQ-activated pathogenicity-related protein